MFLCRQAESSTAQHSAHSTAQHSTAVKSGRDAAGNTQHRHDSWGITRQGWHWTCDESTLSPVTAVTRSLTLPVCLPWNSHGVTFFFLPHQLQTQGCASVLVFKLIMWKLCWRLNQIKHSVGYSLSDWQRFLWCEIHWGSEIENTQTELRSTSH